MEPAVNKSCKAFVIPAREALFNLFDIVREIGPLRPQARDLSIRQLPVAVRVVIALKAGPNLVV